LEVSSISLLLDHRLIAANQGMFFNATGRFINDNSEPTNAAFVSRAFFGLSTYLFFSSSLLSSLVSLSSSQPFKPPCDNA
jgi:hypothetical protein